MSQVDLTIEKPAVGGRMIARHDGRVVLVRGGIPGERARVRLEETRRGVAYGTAVEILQPDPDRRPVGVDPACGGRDFAHIAYPRQLALKQEIVADAFARIGRIRLDEAVPIAASPEEGYRMRTRLHVRRGHVGFFREGTHALCDAAATGQLSPVTSALLPALIAAVPRADAHTIAALDLAENTRGDERALHVELVPGSRVEPDRLAGLALDAFRGLSVSDARTAAPTVVSGDAAVADGCDELLPQADRSVRLRRHPAAFFQANRFLLPSLVAWVADAVPAGPVVDLYAGAGLFAVTLGAAGRAPIVAVEGDPISGDDLAANAAQLGPAVSVHRSTVEAFLEARPQAGVTVIVDPPRTGLSRDAAAALAAAHPPRIVYVSCDVATLARDLQRLLGAGYGIERLKAFDMFPTTAHVEVAVVLVRG